MARRHRDEDEEMVGVVVNLDASLTSITKQNAKLERFAAKIGTAADTLEFRDLLSKERDAAMKLHTGALAEMKRSKSRGQVVARFEKEFKRFRSIVSAIDLKQKQQIVALAGKSGDQHNEFSEAIQRESEEDGGAPSSYSQAQLQNIQFVEYNVDEIATRHGEIRKVEKDLVEVAEMFRDMQQLVDEQQVHIDVIDNNITTAKEKVEKSHKELESASDYQKKARKKACCTVMLVITVVAVVLIVLYVGKKI